ncbi:MAG: inorganic phosphate transporter [Candidatus Cloacimonetes bacterium]|nr:inorganic phosphate transporter [Candidatus Cloacimonadota bacterium]
MMATIFFLSSGLFLGWSLGANNAANFFGTAVGTKMIKFRTAAIFCGIFVILGAVISGAGTADTLSKLGAIDTLPGAFVIALASAITSYFMTRAGLPISTSQAIIGGIVGWNLYTLTPTDTVSLYNIVGTWIFSPVLTAIMAYLLYHIFKRIIDRANIHLLLLDKYTRIGLLLAGVFGSYSLGANNIGNVVGIFMNSSPFRDITIGGIWHISSVQQLFLLGGLAIAVGVFTYSKKVMLTVGSGIYKLSPVTALIVVISVSITLFLFASRGLHEFLVSCHLPAFPLVPVSSSQAVIGAVMGISFAKGARNLRWGKIVQISLGWVITPVLSAVLSYFSLFFMENVFLQSVIK